MLEASPRARRDAVAHARGWAAHARAGRRRCERLIVLSETAGRARGAAARGSTRRAACVLAQRLRPRPLPPRPVVDRAAHWRRHLVDEPRGWRPGRRGRLGALRAEEVEAAFAPGDPVLLYVGRFTAVKRVGAARRGLRSAPARAPRAARRARDRSAATPASGRASTRPRRSSASARATSSSPAGTPTTSCPRSSTPPTRSCSPRCASSSARCSSRRWPAACRPIAVDRYGPAEIVADGRDGLARRARRREGAGRARSSRSSTTRGERARRAERARMRTRWSASRGPPLAQDVARLYEAAVLERRERMGPVP